MSRNASKDRLREVAGCIERLKVWKEEGNPDATARVARLRSWSGRKTAIELIYVNLGNYLNAEHFNGSAHFSPMEESILLELVPLQAQGRSSKADPRPFAALLNEMFPYGTDKRQSIERRLTALLQSPARGISRHLKPLVALMESASGESAAVDWGRLYQDVLTWESPKRFAKKRWAAQFFRSEAQSLKLAGRES